MISHHEWINNDEIFFYGIIDKVKSFFTFNLITKKFKKINLNFLMMMDTPILLMEIYLL